MLGGGLTSSVSLLRCFRYVRKRVSTKLLLRGGVGDTPLA